MNQISKNQTNQYIAPTYARFDVAFVRGEGASLYDDEGKEYIDMGSGIAVNVLGYGNKPWTDGRVRTGATRSRMCPTSITPSRRASLRSFCASARA